MNSIKVLIVGEDLEEVNQIKKYFSDHANVNLELTTKDDLVLALSRNNQSDYNKVVPKDLDNSITKLLHELGVPSHIKGYQYIKEGILYIYDNPFISGITKEVYPDIARIFNTTVSRVERSIRHAIEVSWNRGNWDLMDEIFGHSIDVDKAKPTNSEFIITIADKLRLDYCKNE